MNDSSAVLAAEDARIAIADTVVLQSLNLHTQGQHAIVIDESDSLFELLSGLSARHERPAAPSQAELRFGSIKLLGHDVKTGAHYKVCGFLPHRPQLPPDWRVEHYLGWAAQLTGQPPQDAAPRTQAALARLKLKQYGKRWIKSLSPAEHYLVALAAAIVHEPSLLIFQQGPSSMLAQFPELFAEALKRALDGRASLSLSSALSSLSPVLMAAATDLCVLREGLVIAHAPPKNLPAGARLYDLSVHGETATMCEALSQDGFTISGGPVHFSLTMPDGKSVTDVFRAALQHDATVVNCHPVW